MATLMKIGKSIFYDPQQSFFTSGKSKQKSVQEWKKYFSTTTGKYYGSRKQAEKAESLYETKRKEDRWSKLRELPPNVAWRSVPGGIRKEASGGLSYDPWTGFFIEYGWDPVDMGSALARADQNNNGELEKLLDEWESLI